MKMFNLNCPRCGKFFYGDNAIIQLRTPVHCPKCDAYMPYEEYSKALEGKAGTTLARLSKPVTKENMYEVLYIPGK